MDAVVLALCSAVLFGAMRCSASALARGDDPLVGAFLTIVPATCVALVAAVLAGEWDVAEAWPFVARRGPRAGRLAGPVHLRDA